LVKDYAAFTAKKCYYSWVNLYKAMIKNKKISLRFNDIKKTIHVELDTSHSPRTVKALLHNLPIKVKIYRWGDELYTEKTPIVAYEENAKSIVNVLDVAYWPEGSAICLFFGPTPISKSPDEILPYSPVNIVGKIISEDDILDEIKDETTVVIEAEQDSQNMHIGKY
jgi:hypothetical protein